LPPKSELLVANLVLEDGYLLVPDRPGIGVELKPGIADLYPATSRAIHTPMHEDGSVADIRPASQAQQRAFPAPARRTDASS
jgi:hypothetical protein